jgi:hypothetical protein
MKERHGERGTQRAQYIWRYTEKRFLDNTNNAKAKETI